MSFVGLAFDVVVSCLLYVCPSLFVAVCVLRVAVSFDGVCWLFVVVVCSLFYVICCLAVVVVCCLLFVVFVHVLICVACWSRIAVFVVCCVLSVVV